MTQPFAFPTRELLNDTAIAAMNDARERGMNDDTARACFLEAATAAFDRALETERPEFLG